MAYNFFTQPQGPVIDISLFGDAQTAGIAAGKNLPSKTTAIIQGLTQGISQGMDWLTGMQKIREAEMDIAIKQNTIDRIPKANEIQDLQLEKAQDDMKKQDALQDLEIEQQKAELQKKKQLDQLNSEFIDVTSRNDPNEMAQSYTKFAPIMDTAKGSNYLRGIILNPQTTKENRAFAQEALFKTTTNSLSNRYDAKADADVKAANERINGSAAAASTAAHFGAPPKTPIAAFDDSIIVTQDGTYRSRVRGTGDKAKEFLVLDANKNPIAIPQQESSKTGTYAIWNKTTGERIAGGLTADFDRDYKRVTGHYAAQNGDQIKADIVGARHRATKEYKKAVDDEKSQRQTGLTPKAKNTVDAITEGNLKEMAATTPKLLPAAVVIQNKQLFSAARETLNDESVKTSISNMTKLAEDVRNTTRAGLEGSALYDDNSTADSFSPSTAAFVIQDSKNALLEATARAKFRTLPEDQKKLYSGQALEYYQDRGRATLRNKSRSLTALEREMTPLDNPEGNLYDALVPQTPEDLYVLKNKDSLKKDVDVLWESLYKDPEQTIQSSKAGVDSSAFVADMDSVLQR